MYYISSRRKNGTWGITDTTDGVEEFYTTKFILTKLKDFDIAGVSGDKISVVNASTQIIGSNFDEFEKLVRMEVDNWTEEDCLSIARTGHFVRKIKDLSGDAMKEEMVRNIYPDSVREVVESSYRLGNSVRIADVGSIADELKHNVCVVLQHRTDGILTAFICTAGIEVEDALYGQYNFDAAYLTKQLYGYTFNCNKVRPQRAGEPKEKNKNLLNVMSCSLRFRNSGKGHDGAIMCISSPFYTVNLERVLAVAVIENPNHIGDILSREYRFAANKDMYDFSPSMYARVKKDVQNNTNSFITTASFAKYILKNPLFEGVEVTDLVQRYAENFGYMRYIRQSGFTFK